MRRSILSGLAVASIMVILSTQIALAAPNHRRITILDNCDGPSFTAAIGEGSCERASGMGFETFFGLLADGGASPGGSRRPGPPWPTAAR